MTAWTTLGIEGTTDISAIRRAYADALRALDVDPEPARFETLHRARDAALAMARSGNLDEDEDGYGRDEEDEDEQETIGRPPVDVPPTVAARRHLLEALLRPPGDAAPAPLDAAETALLLDHVHALLTDPALDRIAVRRDAEAWIGELLAATPPRSDAGLAPVVDAWGWRATRGRADQPAAIVAVLNRLDQLGDRPAGPSPRIDPLQAHHESLVSILAPADPAHRDQPLDPDEQAAAARHIVALLADPRLDGIELRAQASHWFADLLVSTAPRSDTVLGHAIEAFGWEGEVGRFDTPDAIETLVGRWRGAKFLDAIERPGHRFHRAWRELSRPAGRFPRRGWGVGRARVSELLKRMRSDAPGLEDYLDPRRVGLWEWEWPGMRRRSPWWVTAILALVVVRLFVVLSEDIDGSHRAPIHPPLVAADTLVSGASPAVTLDPVLLAVGGPALTLRRVQADNPGLYGALLSAHADGERRGARPEDFGRSVATLLSDRYEAALMRAPYSIVQDLRRLQNRAARHVQAQDAARCVAYVRGRMMPGADDLPPPLHAALLAIHGRILLTVDSSVPTGAFPTSVRIPRDLVERAERASGLAEGKFRAALRSDDAPDACAAHLALVETVLRLPPARGLALLRVL